MIRFRWFGAGKTAYSSRNRRRLGYETLERREVMTASFDSAFSVGVSGEWAKAVSVDSAGNTYLAGMYNSTVDFDHTHSNPAAVLTSQVIDGMTVQDGFIAKYNTDGSFAWVVDLGPGAANAVDVDDSGRVSVSGSFYGSVTWGAVGLTSYGGSTDGYVVRLDPSGAVQWAHQFGTAYEPDMAQGVVVDASGNTYVTGSVSQNTKTSAFVAKLDAGGSQVWLKQVGGASVTDGNGVAVDGAGNVVTVGTFHGANDFDPGPGTYKLESGGRNVQPSPAAFVLKLNSSGGFVWAEAFQASQWSSSSAADLAVDASNNIYVTGSFAGTVDFDPGKGKLSLPNAGGSDAYVVKLNPTGSLAWARSMGSTDHDSANDIAVDSFGGVYLTGSFSRSFSVGGNALTNSGGEDVFVVKLNSSGAYQWAVAVGGSDLDRAEGIDVDASGNVYVTGLFKGSADYDPGAGTYSLVASPGYAIFFLKLKQP